MSTGRRPANRRWWLWLPLLAVGAWLAIFGDKSPASDAAASAPVAAVVPSPRSAPAAPAVSGPAGALPDTALALVPRDQLFAAADAAGHAEGSPRDLFSVRSWTPPPAAPATAPAPTAPPVPYTYVGKKLEADAWEVYLARGEQAFVTRTGQVLEGDWRVDRIAPPALELTYLPLGQALTLSIGDNR